MTKIRSRLRIIVELLNYLNQIKPKSIAISRLTGALGLHFTNKGKPLVNHLHKKFLIKYDHKKNRTYISITQTGIEKLQEIKQLLNELGIEDFEEWETKQKKNDGVRYR